MGTPGPVGRNIARGESCGHLPLQTTLTRGVGGDWQSGCEPRACFTRVMWFRAIFILSEGETRSFARGCRSVLRDIFEYCGKVCDLLLLGLRNRKASRARWSGSYTGHGIALASVSRRPCRPILHTGGQLAQPHEKCSQAHYAVDETRLRWPRAASEVGQGASAVS